MILVSFWLQSSQQSKLADGDDQKEVSSYEQSHESSQQARVAQSLQAHDYVSVVVFLVYSVLSFSYLNDIIVH